MSQSYVLESEQANLLFDQMHRIVEDRKSPVIESYHTDFYKFDRMILSDKFSSNARYLWLLHPSGSHFGRIGVLPDERDMMHAALKCYANAHAMDRMELRVIETDAQGAAKIKKISFEEGFNQIRRKDYKMLGDVLCKGSEQIAKVDIKLNSLRPGEYNASAEIASLQSSLTREQSIAAIISAASMIAVKTSLFTNLKTVFIDGHDANETYPLLDIKEVTRGLYAPIALEQEDGGSPGLEQFIQRERQRA